MIVDRLYGSHAPFQHDSAIQPASVDLHIGFIFIPERDDDEVGGLHRPRKNHSLAPGHSVMIETKEMLRIPNDVAGMGFPLARMSSRGLLMTNPGHVDPGYRGRMTFTAINMGRQPFELREDDSIVTLLLFKLDAPVTKGFATRYENAQPQSVTSEKLDSLSDSFLDVERRAENVVQREEVRTRRWSVVVPAVIVALGILSSIVANYLQRQLSIDDEIRRLDRELSIMQSHLNSEASLEELHGRIDALEDAARNGL